MIIGVTCAVVTAMVIVGVVVGVKFSWTAPATLSRYPSDSSYDSDTTVAVTMIVTVINS